MDAIEFLGSGSALNLAREPSCFALHHGKQIMLVDTGGGVGILKQLRQARIKLSRVEYIYLTHTDFDHSSGLAPLLLAKALEREQEQEAVHILGSRAVLRRVRRVLATTGNDVLRLWRNNLCWHPVEIGRRLAIDTRLSIIPVPASHQQPPFQPTGLLLDLSNVRICYSGDTRPHAGLATYAAGAQWLIHEASFTQEYTALAHQLGHSTAAEAGELAAALGVERLIVTHVGIDTRHTSEARLIQEAQQHFTGDILVAREGICLFIGEPAHMSMREEVAHLPTLQGRTSS